MHILKGYLGSKARGSEESLESERSIRYGSIPADKSKGLNQARGRKVERVDTQYK